MPVKECDCTVSLSFPVLRWVRAFGPRMRGGLVRALQAKQRAKGTLTSNDICECIDVAWAMLEADAEMRVEFPAPDQTTVDIARQQIRDKKGSSIDEILNGLS